MTSENTQLVTAKPIDLAKLTAENLCNSCTSDADEAGRIARGMFDTLQRNSIRIAEHAVVFGCYLAECRAVIGYGGFTDWLTKHFDTSRRTAYHYLSLAEHFSRSVKLLPDEFASITAVATNTADEHDAPTLVREKLAAFVGEQSLSDLYRRYKIAAPKGGKTYERDGVKGRRLSAVETQEAQLAADREHWLRWTRELGWVIDRSVGRTDSWRALHPQEIEDLRGLLLDFAHRISAFQKGEPIS